MKLSDVKGEKALDMLADLIDPASEIMADKEIKAVFQTRGKKGAEKPPKMRAVKLALKKHKGAVMEILAALEGKDPDTYAKEVNILTLPMKLLDILNDKELMGLFTSQGQSPEAFGSATENTGGKAQ